MDVPRRGFFQSGRLLTDHTRSISLSQTGRFKNSTWELYEKQSEDFHTLLDRFWNSRRAIDSRIPSLITLPNNFGFLSERPDGGGVMNAVAIAVDKRRQIERLWKKLRGTKIDTSEYKTLIHEIGVLVMEYHAVTEHDTKISESH